MAIKQMTKTKLSLLIIGLEIAISGVLIILKLSKFVFWLTLISTVLLIVLFYGVRNEK